MDIRIWLQTHYPAGYPTGKPDSDHLCCLVTCHSTMLTVVRLLQLSFISGRKLDAGYGTFCPAKQKTGYAGC